jgi:protein-S-isoprenylcysteine O-methyltransferase Ste14
LNGDLLFRILFLVLFVPGIGIRGDYTRRVRTSRKKRSWNERLRDTVQAEGKTGALLLIGQGIYLIIVVLLYLLLSPSPLWFDLPLADWLRWIGVALGALSLPFLAWVHYTLDKHWDISLSLRKDHVLVTSGPYRRIRHPMYTVHIVYFFAWVLVSANLLLLINYLLTILLITLRIPKEEQMLLERFGEEYRAYIKRTGRLLPRFHQEKMKANEI